MTLVWTENPDSVSGQQVGAGGPGTLVTINDVSDQVRLSEDNGATWDTYALPAVGGGWVRLFYSWELEQYIAFSNAGSGDNYATSPDGKVWTLRTFPVAASDFQFAEGDGAVALVSPTFDAQVRYSSNLISWNTTTPGSTTLSDIAFGNGLWLVVTGSNVFLGNNGYHHASSLVGAWTGAEFPGDARCGKCAYGNGVFLATNNFSLALYRSASGTGSWVSQSAPAILSASSDIQFVVGTALSIFVINENASPGELSWSTTGLSDSWESLITSTAPAWVLWNRDVVYALIDSDDDLSAELVLPPVPVQVIDQLAMQGLALHHPVKIQVDGIALSGDARRLYTAVLRSIAAMATQQAPGFDGGKSATDRVVFAARLAYVFQVLVEEGLVLGGSAVPEYRIVVRAVSRLLMEGVARGVAEAIAAVTDALVMGAAASSLQLADASDTVAMRGLLDSLYTAIGKAVERLLLRDAPSGVFMAIALVRDTAVLSSGTSLAAELLASIRDGVGFAATLQIDNFEYVAWVMNTQSKGVWRYTNYPFNSFAKVRGNYYGAASDGLHDLQVDGDAGEPIAWKIRLGLAASLTRRLKRYPEVFIAVRGDGEMFLKVITIDEVTGDKQACIYRMARRAAPEHRQKIGRGLQSVEWDWELSGAGNIELSALQFHPLILDRRTRG
jgi:hypothetical protein